MFFMSRRLPKECHSVMYEVQEFSPLLDSSNMNVDDWAKIARIIEVNIHIGIIIFSCIHTFVYACMDYIQYICC